VNLARDRQSETLAGRRLRQRRGRDGWPGRNGRSRPGCCRVLAGCIMMAAARSCGIVLRHFRRTARASGRRRAMRRRAGPIASEIFKFHNGTVTVANTRESYIGTSCERSLSVRPALPGPPGRGPCRPLMPLSGSQFPGLQLQVDHHDDPVTRTGARAGPGVWRLDREP
jgi:hypothetical protein